MRGAFKYSEVGRSRWVLGTDKTAGVAVVDVAAVVGVAVVDVAADVGVAVVVVAVTGVVNIGGTTATVGGVGVVIGAAVVVAIVDGVAVLVGVADEFEREREDPSSGVAVR